MEVEHLSVGGRRIRVIKSLAASFHILEGTRFSVVHASAIPTCLTFEDDLVLKLYRHEISASAFGHPKSLFSGQMVFSRRLSDAELLFGMVILLFLGNVQLV